MFMKNIAKTMLYIVKLDMKLLPQSKSDECGHMIKINYGEQVGPQHNG